MSNLAHFQKLHQAWSQYNFGDQPSDNAFLGMVEEMGELSHALLKGRQGIRGTVAKHDAAAKDAVGDLLLYLFDFCSRKGWDVETILQDTTRTVHARDWKKYPGTGRP